MTEISYKDGVIANVKADLPFHLFVLFYGVAALMLALYLGRPEKMQALMYATRFVNLIMAVLCLYFVRHAVASLAAPSALKDLKARLQTGLSPTIISRGILFTNIAVFYGIFTSVKRMLSDIRGFAYDVSLANVDQMIHGVDPWSLLPYSETLTRVVQFFYLHGWLSCLVLFSCYVIVYQPLPLVRRYMACFYMVWILLGNVFAGIFMSAGPVYYKMVTGSDRFEPLVAKLEYTLGMANSSINVQDTLWEDYMLDLGLLGSGISAFPSLHVGMATLWVITAWSINKTLFAFFLAILVIIQASSVYLGWHYAADGYFSMVAVMLIWFSVKYMYEPKARGQKLSMVPAE